MMTHEQFNASLQVLADELHASWMNGNRSDVVRSIQRHKAPTALTALVCTRFRYLDVERLEYELNSFYSFLARTEEP
jgi:hypothetical protein